MKIRSVNAIEILDSRGNPTIKATVMTTSGDIGSAAVPSGASTGVYEATELRDGDPKRFGGKGVLNAIDNIVGEIADSLTGKEVDDQEAIDRTMIDLDGTENKSRLGANAILSVSLAAARSASASVKKPLYEYLGKFSEGMIMPMPMMNIMNGGRHADFAADIQEYMVIPVSAADISQAVRMCSEVYASLKSVLKDGNYSISVGDEGGFAPAFSNNGEPFELMAEAVLRAGYNLGTDIVFAIDAAASEFYSEGKYILKRENKELSSSELLDFYKNMIARYPVISIEDPFAEDDWEAFSLMTSELGDGIQIVGDDLYVTNVKRINKGIGEKATNSVLIKPNQIGTLTETIEAIKLAYSSGQTAVISHRSGETEDAFIADLSVAMGTGQIKSGAPARGERTAKYNRLMEIEKESGLKVARMPFI